MEVFGFYLLTGFLTSGLLVVFYIVTLGHVLRGRKFPIIIGMISLLIASNLASLVQLTANYEIIHIQRDASKPWIFWDWVAGISQGVIDLTFGLAHWILAFYYFTVANGDPNHTPVMTQSKLYWTGVAANIVFPICEGAFAAYYFSLADQGIDRSHWLYYALTGMLFATNLAQIASGIILIWSIFKIKRSLNGQKNEVDVKKLTLHSLTFSLFLASNLVYVVAQAGYIASNYGGWWFNVLSFVTIIEEVLSFISQSLLCVIFWQLCSVKDIMVEEFDKEAELQARIWAHFMRNRTSSQQRDSLVNQSIEFLQPGQLKES